MWVRVGWSKYNYLIFVGLIWAVYIFDVVVE